MKEKNTNRIYQMENFCSSKDTIKEVRREATD